MQVNVMSSKVIKHDRVSYLVVKDNKEEQEQEYVSCSGPGPLVPGWQQGWHGAVCLH